MFIAYRDYICLKAILSKETSIKPKLEVKCFPSKLELSSLPVIPTDSKLGGMAKIGSIWRPNGSCFLSYNRLSFETLPER